LLHGNRGLLIDLETTSRQPGQNVQLFIGYLGLLIGNSGLQIGNSGLQIGNLGLLIGNSGLLISNSGLLINFGTTLTTIHLRFMILTILTVNR
jgi:hypothetical protein